MGFLSKAYLYGEYKITNSKCITQHSAESLSTCTEGIFTERNYTMKVFRDVQLTYTASNLVSAKLYGDQLGIEIHWQL